MAEVIRMILDYLTDPFYGYCGHDEKLRNELISDMIAKNDNHTEVDKHD